MFTSLKGYWIAEFPISRDNKNFKSYHWFFTLRTMYIEVVSVTNWDYLIKHYTQLKNVNNSTTDSIPIVNKYRDLAHKLIQTENQNTQNDF